MAVPLTVTDELIGLLAVYLPRGRALAADESALLSALAVQLSVAVQNARLHEQTRRLASEREQLLAAESETARELRSLYEISRSFVTLRNPICAAFENGTSTVMLLHPKRKR